jgi:hypothetical protein
MERSHRFSFGAELARLAAAVLALCVITACQAESDKPSVVYLGGPALGTWLSPAGAGGQDGVAGAAPLGGIGGTEAGTGVLPSGGAGGLSGAGSAAAGEGGIGGMGQTGGTGGGDSGTGGGAGTSGGAGTVATGLSSLAFDVQTLSQGGKYSPRNVGAIWIETSGGDFVKTLEVWAERRAGELTRWRNETSSNRVDAVSGATLRSHAVHRVTWDLSDVSGNPVGPGDYKIVIEATDRDSTGASHEVAFTLGADPQVITPADGSAFSSMSLTLE